MRSRRFPAVLLMVSCAVALAGCGGDDAPSAAPAPTQSSVSANVSDFPEIPGFSYKELAPSAFRELNSALKATPQIDGVAAKFATKDGKEAGLVMRVAIPPETAGLEGFAEQFVPGLLSGIAGSSAAPTQEDINGTSVTTITSPGEAGAAYAWLEGSIATVLVFEDPANAEAFAQAALA